MPLALEEWETNEPTSYRGGGIGYVFTEEDPYVGLDFDRCVDPVTGVIADWAQGHIDGLASYTEVTPSGTGLHTIVQGALPPKGRRKGPIEMYSYARFFTMTGWRLDELPPTVEPRQYHSTRSGVASLPPPLARRSGSNDKGNITNARALDDYRDPVRPVYGPYAQFGEAATGWPLIQCEVAPCSPGPGTVYSDRG